MSEMTRLQDRPALRESRVVEELMAGVSPETRVLRDEPLARRTTLRVGGSADVYVEPASEADLATVLRFCAAHELPFLVLGRGSNLLVRDGGFRGVVIALAHPVFARIEVEGTCLRCGAGARLKQVAAEARRQSLGGLEFLDGIPGSVGGALRMNAGAMGSATFDVVRTVRAMDTRGVVHEWAAAELEPGYRCCPRLKDHVALGAVFEGRPAPPEEIARRTEQWNLKRWHTQPASPSAGCIFKNPPGIPAGRLIEELGLKGARVGGAAVSAEHGNFIVNEGNARARDVLELIALIKYYAKAQRGIELETEVVIVGED